MVQLATADEGAVVKTDDLAKAQGIPPQFLVDILSDLRTDRLVRSHRGRDGGYELARPAAEISLADVLRCIDGPLASVRDIGLGDLPYSGPTAALTDVWRALRASMRSVLEQTSLAEVAVGCPAQACRQAGRRLSRPGDQARPLAGLAACVSAGGALCPARRSRRAACAGPARSPLPPTPASATCESASTWGCAAPAADPMRAAASPASRPRVNGPASSAWAAPTTSAKHGVECGEAVGVGEAPAAKCGDERVGHGETGRRRRAARQHQRNGGGMRADAQPHRLGHRVDVVDPVRGRLGHPHLGDDRGDDQFLQPLLVGHVVVDRHRSGAQRCRQRAHAQRAHARRRRQCSAPRWRSHRW